MQGSMLFPTTIRDEFHEFRKVIEQVSGGDTLAGVEDGVVISGVAHLQLRATLEDGSRVQFVIDRLE